MLRQRKMSRKRGSAGAGASISGHRDATVVLKVVDGKHIDQRADHLRGLLEATSEPPNPPQPEPKKGRKKGDKKGKQEERQTPPSDENPHGLKVIGEVPPPKLKGRKRDAG